MINNVFSIAGFVFLSAVAPYLLYEDKIQIHETQCNAVMLASENDGLPVLFFFLPWPHIYSMRTRSRYTKRNVML